MPLSALADPWIGRRVRSDITIEQRLSSVDSLYRAHDEAGRNLFARFHRIHRLSTPPDWTTRAKRLRLLRSRRLSHFVDAIEHDEYAVILSEYVEGERLHDRLRRCGPLPVNDALVIATQVALALEALQGSGLFHARVNPRCIVVATDARGLLRATLTSYGIASGLQPRIVDPGYRPPDQRSDRAADDIFAVGALLFEMLTGVVPDEGVVDADIRDIAPSPLKNPSAFVRELARVRGVDALVQDLTAASEYRVGSISRVVALLEDLREDVTTATPLPMPQMSRPRTFTGAEDTGVGRPSRTSPIGRPEREVFARYAGVVHAVEVSGTKLRVSEVDSAGQWGRESTVFDLGEYSIDGRLECVAACDERVWFGTSRGVLGWFDIAAACAEFVATVPDRSPIIAIDACDGLVVAGSRGGLVLYATPGGPAQSLPGDAPVSYVTVTRDGARFAVGRSTGTVDVFDVVDGRPSRVRDFEVAEVTGIRLSDDGRELWLSDRDTTMIRDLSTGASLGTVEPIDILAPDFED